MIANNAQAESHLISELLDLSGIAAGKLALQSYPVDLMCVVDAAVDFQQKALEAKELRVTIDRGAEAAIVSGDSDRLQQVLRNLLSNAIKFTPQGGSIAVRLQRISAYWELSICDTGEGIPAEFMPHLFDHFRQADSGTARRFGGLGIGLALVRRLVELHGGSIRAHSDGPGCGATFTVQLPVHLGTPNCAPASEIDIATSPPTSALRGIRVLAVEDEPDMLEYVRRVLEEQGASVVAVASARAAIEHLKNNPSAFDLLISDIGMSVMDGYELMTTVREQLNLGPDRLKAVAVTAFTRDQDRRRALDVGFQAILAKPYPVSALVRVLRELTSSQPNSPIPSSRKPRLRLVEDKDFR